MSLSVKSLPASFAIAMQARALVHWYRIDQELGRRVEAGIAAISARSIAK